MFRKKAYFFLFIISAALWCAAAVQHAQVHNFSAKKAAQLVVDHLEKSERVIAAFFTNNTGLISRASQGAQSPADANALATLPASIFIYNGTKLISWNTSSATPLLPENVPPPSHVLIQDGAIYLTQILQPVRDSPALLVVVLYPILEGYPFENDYLVSHFVGAQRIPSSAQFSDTSSPTAAPVILHDGRRIGYMVLSTEDASHHRPDFNTTLLTILAAIMLLAGVQVLAISVRRQRGTVLAVIIVIGAATILRTALYFFGLPFELNEWHLFSPLLYASSVLHPSLGDLLLNAIAMLWIAVFISSAMPRRSANINFNSSWPKALAIALLMCAIGYGTTRIIASLALNSIISFDVPHFYAFDADTISGLVTVSLLTGAASLLLHRLLRLLKLVATSMMQYVCMAIGCALIYATGWPKDESHLYIFFCGWMLLLVLISDIKRLLRSTNFFTPEMLFWMVFFCASATILFQHYIDLHELETRKSFAERIVQRRDNIMEWSFNEVPDRIKRDSFLNTYLSKPSLAGRAAFTERLSALYLNNELNNYSADILLFDAQHRPVFNDDTIAFSALEARESLGQKTDARDLLYFEGAPDEHDYLAHTQLKDSVSGAITDLYIDLVHKKTSNETVLPELLQPALINKAQRESDYQYAVYTGGRLVIQSPDYPFPYYVRQSANESEYEWHQNTNVSTLRYRPDKTREALIVRVRDTFKATFTLFSYLLGLQLIISLLIASFRYVLNRLDLRRSGKRPVVSFTLRQRIQLSMLGVVLISFLIIAITTIAFFRQRYEESNRRNIQGTLQNAERAISQYLIDNNRKGSVMAATAEDFDFRKFISALAQQQKADVNVYDVNGQLVTTSQADIYDRGILNRLMRPQVLTTLRNSRQALLIRQEDIGKLNYISSYVPLNTQGGAVIGYINIPFFSSQKEIDAQVSNILVALINLYAFIFLLSSLLAVITTRWLTRTLAVIIQQFNTLGLAGNELLEWPYEDEIGVLVREYNKMVKKVEESATLLAQSEREGAWREMARQVAHEIKNPLTPMKLNIQYLQKALRDGHPDLSALTIRVADSMLEQIDNLSYIASEFSNFAKLPEAKPEEILLNELLEKSTTLYNNEENVEVSFSQPQLPLLVYADRSQLNRIINNLLQNAVQAIPTDERKGLIKISLAQSTGNLAVIAIQDNGKGISPDVAKRLFQPYFTTKSSGTGLGLAMTRKMVELWKGRIWYETVEGAGTTFFIELPLSNTAT